MGMGGAEDCIIGFICGCLFLLFYREILSYLWTEWTSFLVNYYYIESFCCVTNQNVKGPVQSKSMFISIDQLPKIIEFHTIIVHNYSSVDFILIFFDTSAAILKNLKLY